jgi:hypothetical protein
MTKTAATLSATLLALTSAAAIARAEVSEPALHLDLEVDPTAYLMSGYSLHAGVGWRRLRVDLGAYAMDVPGFLHGNDGFDASFAGAGAKLQYFPLAAQRGLFVDVGFGVSRREVVRADTGATASDVVTSLGASAGYRFGLPYGFYATPWAGINVDLDHRELTVDGRTFAMSRVTPFAAIHVGYRFR